MTFRLLCTTVLTASVLAGCSTIDGDRVSVKSAQDVNDHMTFKRDSLTRSLDLQTESYWTKCESEWDGLGYRYRTSVYPSGNQQTQIYIRLKSSQGAYDIEKAFDDNGEHYPVELYKPENKSDSVVYENLALNISPEQLKAASKAPVVMHLKGKQHDCTFTVEQPVSYAFSLNYDELMKQVSEAKKAKPEPSKGQDSKEAVDNQAIESENNDN